MVAGRRGGSVVGCCGRLVRDDAADGDLGRDGIERIHPARQLAC